MGVLDEYDGITCERCWRPMGELNNVQLKLGIFKLCDDCKKDMERIIAQR